MSKLKLSNNDLSKVLSILLGLAMLLCFNSTANAASDNTDHQVTVIVPSILSLQADQSNFTLTFSDFDSGSESDQQTVNYTVKANNMTKTNGVLHASLSSVFDDLDFLADVGVYNKQGGNASLVESSPVGFKVITTSGTNLCDRNVDSGNGKVTRGTLPITYKAISTAPMSAASQVRTLTITLVDT